MNDIREQITWLHFIETDAYERKGQIRPIQGASYRPEEAVFRAVTAIERRIWGFTHSYAHIVRVESPDGFSGYALAEMKEEAR